MSVHLSTVLTRSPATLSSIASRLAKTYPGFPLLFALTSNAPPQDLSRLVRELTGFSSETAGCLSAPLPFQGYDSRISCSIAIFDPVNAVLFRSTIPGRAQPQVGRWHAFRNKDNPPPEAQLPSEEPIHWDDVWRRDTASISLPPELQSLKTGSPNSLTSITPSSTLSSDAEVSEIIYMSDRSPEGLLNSLNAFPKTTRLGLIASSTPFITGRPVTLFYKGGVFDNGAVGFALKQPRKATPRTEFPGVVPLSEPMTITRVEGNMIISLEGSNPTQLLLNALRNSGMHMDSSGFLKYEDSFLVGTLRDDKPSRMYTITAGDPGRGSISLESPTAPVAGTKVQFFHCPQPAVLDISLNSDPKINAFRFLISPETIPSISSGAGSSPLNVEDGDTEIISNQFLVASENGFVMSQSGEAAWTCNVVGGSAALEWSSS